MKKLKTFRCAILICLAVRGVPSFGQSMPSTAVSLLDRLTGEWVLEGRLGSKQVTHDVSAEWILNREYLRLHEVSRDKNRFGHPAYEALVFFGWDAKAQEYRCLWLDNTDGSGLSVPIARGKRMDQSIQIAFPAPFDSLHTTFKYDERADQWQLLIDDRKDGKPYRFGDTMLKRVDQTPK